MIIDLPESERPLCPNIKDPLHRLHIEIVDAFYNKAEKNEDDELLDPKVAELYAEIAYGRFGGRMYLYKETVQPMDAYMMAQRRSVQSWYFRCYLCGFTVPAVAGNW